MNWLTIPGRYNRGSGVFMRLYGARRITGNKVANGASNIPVNLGGQPASAPLTADVELRLLRRCRRGDRAAWQELLVGYQDRVFAAILRMCGNRDDAEELCQETFVRAMESLPSFRQDSGFYTWLFRIGVNLTISRRRRGGRVRFVSLEPPPGDDEARRRELTDQRGPAPHDQVDRADTHQRVLEAIGELNDEFRAVVVLRDVEEMNYQQISQVLQVPVGTVKSRLFRARAILQKKLRDLM